jgi:hypothetical protein
MVLKASELNRDYLQCVKMLLNLKLPPHHRYWIPLRPQMFTVSKHNLCEEQLGSI